jgi:hypothetical protein
MNEAIGVPAKTAHRFEKLDLAGFQQLLPMTLVAFFCHRVFLFGLSLIIFLWGESLDGG